MANSHSVNGRIIKFKDKELFFIKMEVIFMEILRNLMFEQDLCNNVLGFH